MSAINSEPLKKGPSWEKKNTYIYLYIGIYETDMERRARELFLKVLPGAFYATKSILKSNTMGFDFISRKNGAYNTPTRDNRQSDICADILHTSNVCTIWLKISFTPTTHTNHAPHWIFQKVKPSPFKLKILIIL